ncbi:MAG: hypothetical protein KGY99_02105 [Phycisphaerae bacterium]|nr:hypothetical protein [Phycisphaerae bacterium]
MARQTEGTLVLDGLIEGSCEDLGDKEARLRQWTASAQMRGVTFHLETDGNTFSVLADATPIGTDGFSEAPDRAIADLIDELLAIFAADQRGGIFSTLRSREFRSGEEIQTLYAIGPDGATHTQQRVVDADTAPAEKPLTRTQKLRRIALAAGIAAVVLAVLALFLPVGDWLRSARDRLMPYDVAALTVEAETFEPYFAVVERKTARGGRDLVLVVERGERFPPSDAAAAELLAREDASPPERLAAEAICRGYVRCERFDKDGTFMGHTMERIAGLRDEETIEIHLPIDPEHQLARVRITY